MSIIKDHVIPISLGVVLGISGGVLGIEWAWISIITAAPAALLSSKTSKSILNTLITSLIVFTTPLIVYISRDSQVIKVLDILSSIAGVNQMLLLILPVSIYVAISILSCIFNGIFKENTIISHIYQGFSYYIDLYPLILSPHFSLYFTRVLIGLRVLGQPQILHISGCLEESHI
ncbi:MAG: hypothetical protein QXX47_03940 [Sulfolobales archaeon]